MDSTLREDAATTTREVSRAFAEGAVTKEALKLALETLECWQRNEDCNEPMSKILEAIKEALAQPEQEPVGKFAEFTDGIWREVTDGSAGVPLYTTPPQRTWVGLTNQERSECWETIPELAMKKVEAKLKEKNT